MAAILRLGLLAALAHVGGPVWNLLRNRGCGCTWECLLGREQRSVGQVVRVIHCYLPCLEPGARTDIDTASHRPVHSF